MVSIQKDVAGRFSISPPFYRGTLLTRHFRSQGTAHPTSPNSGADVSNISASLCGPTPVFVPDLGAQRMEREPNQGINGSGYGERVSSRRFISSMRFRVSEIKLGSSPVHSTARSETGNLFTF